MNKTIRFVTAIAAAGALTTIATAPAGAQEALGFSVDSTEGAPGDEVNGQVDVDDVAQNCTTDLEGLAATFTDYGTALQELFPDVNQSNPETAEDLAVVMHLSIATAATVIPDLGEDILAQTFIMSFADIATQDPVGNTVAFDPAVGEATVTVPDLDPGLWAVAAACVSPTADEDAVVAGMDASIEFLRNELDLPAEPFNFSEDVLPNLPYDDVLEMVMDLGPTLLTPVMEPDALGAEIYCIVDSSGECPEDPADVDDPTDPGDDPTTPAASPVTGDPSLTG